MFTYLQSANIKVSPWLLMESRMCVFSKEVMRNEITLYERKGSKSDLPMAVSGWENKVMGTESDKEVSWKVDPKERALCIIQVFLTC